MVTVMVAVMVAVTVMVTVTVKDRPGTGSTGTGSTDLLRHKLISKVRREENTPSKASAAKNLPTATAMMLPVENAEGCDAARTYTARRIIQPVVLYSPQYYTGRSIIQPAPIHCRADASSFQWISQ